MNTEYQLPPFRELHPDRLQLRETHLLDEIRGRFSPARPRIRHDLRRTRVAIAAASFALAVAAVPALALSTGLRELIGLDLAPHAVPVPRFTSLADKLTIGMSKPEVRRRIGSPTTIVGACWQYRERVKIGRGQTLEAERFCFVDGKYLYRYSKVDGSWDYPTRSGDSHIESVPGSP